MIGIKLAACFFIILSVHADRSRAENKYSEKLNTKQSEDHVNFRTLEKPFRMAKLNNLWMKAQIRLTEPKLKSLYSDLKIQDKEEIAFKRFTHDHEDKDGLKEAEIRRKLSNIMASYNLLDRFEDGQTATKDEQKVSSEDYINKSLFQDKKLQKLWHKAEMGGFSSEELQMLKEEFHHLQNKINLYHSIFDEVEQDKADDIENALDKEERDKYNDIAYHDTQNNHVDPKHIQKTNLIRKKHEEIKDGFDKLHRLASQGPLSKDFIEPKVQLLWSSAMRANFSPNELESLRVELQHYEARLLKLRHLQADHATNIESMDTKMKENGLKPEGHRELTDKINKQMKKVEKLHLDIEGRIKERHSEL